MLIENVGPKIEARDIATLEAALGADLPDSYREFLLLYNGGVQRWCADPGHGRCLRGPWHAY